jgi:hypothetical protein
MSEMIYFTEEEKELYISIQGPLLSYYFDDEKQMVIGVGVFSRKEMIDLPYDFIKYVIDNLKGET